ncbi:MAG: DUF928 domain-containing protein [Leptolyngbyaceae bacterium]|nr:DUF928 domain-containing protein [Leptolyngbyaceae bacterium]
MVSSSHSIAQTPTPISSSDEPGDAVTSVITTNFAPSNNGVPSDTVGGGSRNSGMCPTNSDSYGTRLTPIVADNSQNLTTLERPSVLVHIQNESVSQLFLSVKDEQGNYEYQTLVSIPEESGILNITLPDDAPPLVIGNTYQWSLVIVCGESLRADDPLVQGLIQRVEGTATGQGASMNQVVEYGNLGVWYDTIATLATIRQAQPEDAELLSMWNQLLTEVELDELGSAPLIF